METRDYAIAVTTRLNGSGVLERLVTVRADSVQEAEQLYRDVLARLPEWGPEPPDGQEKAGKQGADAQECPQHHRAKAGRYGPYCPTRLEDGSWCRWRPRKGKAKAA